MSIYLVRQYFKNHQRQTAVQEYLEEHVKLIQKHQGEVVTIFQPVGHELNSTPDEIHIIRFVSPENFNAYKNDPASRVLKRLQRQAMRECIEYQSETIAPPETKFATIISASPPEIDQVSVNANEMVERMTQLIERPAFEKLHPAQRQDVLNTQVISPRNEAQKKLSVLVPKWQKENDRRVIFAHTYFLMTNNMLEALDAGKFHDREWVGTLLKNFAQYYFTALNNYETSPFKTPPIWKVAFQVAENPNSYTAQHLLLGVNAHINFDLTKTLIDMLKGEWKDLNPAQKQDRYEDHTRVNKVIETTFDETQELIIARYSPTLDVLNQFSFNLDGLVISKLIETWREQAWRHAVDYLEGQTWAEKHSVIQETEYIALRRADLIMLKQGPFRMQRLF